MTVSIIIPVYQVAPYISNCLRSVMNQSYTGSMECLIIDDCGTDNSIEIAERMIEAYEGQIVFRVIRHERNRGLSAARNTGMANANGEYIFFLDSDDEISSDCISILVLKATEFPKTELIQGNNYTFSSAGKPIKRVKNKSISVVATNDKIRNCYYQEDIMVVAAWNKLLRRSFLEKNKMCFMEGMIMEDVLWTFQLIKHLSCICFVPQVTYHYKMRQNSITTGANYIAMAENVRIIYHYIITNLTPGHIQEEYCYFAKKFCFYYARFLCIAPGFKDDLHLWQEMADEYGSKGVRMRMFACPYLAKLKYGWVALSLLNWIENPSTIWVDIQRMWNKLLWSKKQDFVATTYTTNVEREK